MNMIATTDELARFCKQAADDPYVTLDTEFLRERTYYAQLCLVQIARPGRDAKDAVLVDTLAEGLDLTPLFELFANPAVTKVFHAARQDLEIFWHQGGLLPAPFFDTQVAAMVCGFGDQVGYETLVRRIARAQVDKSSRFTDWSARPLSTAQMDYALADVTHLRPVYEHLSGQLDKTGRRHWVEEELALLMAPQTYVTRPEDAWERVRTRNGSARFLAIVRELARFREEYAQERNVPRSRVYKDDALLEIASAKPASLEALGKMRLLLREARRSPVAEGILDAVKRAVELPAEALPAARIEVQRPQGSEALSDLLRVLLKAKSDEANVAARLIASSADLDAIAAEDAPDVPALRGWRHEIFGADAMRLKAGEIALSAQGSKLKVVPA